MKEETEPVVIEEVVYVLRNVDGIINHSPIKITQKNIIKQLSNGHSLILLKMPGSVKSKCSMCSNTAFDMFCPACMDEKRVLCVNCFGKKHNVAATLNRVR
jgi:recombinational DNA repair protein RecR